MCRRARELSVPPRCRPSTRCRARSRSSPDGRSPRAFALRVHPSSPRLLFRVPSLDLPSLPFGRNSTCRGFAALFATSPNPSTPRKASNPRFVPSPGFLNLSTVFSGFRLASLAHPAATFRVLPARPEAQSPGRRTCGAAACAVPSPTGIRMRRFLSEASRRAACFAPDRVERLGIGRRRRDRSLTRAAPAGRLGLCETFAHRHRGLRRRLAHPPFGASG